MHKTQYKFSMYHVIIIVLAAKLWLFRNVNIVLIEMLLLETHSYPKLRENAYISNALTKKILTTAEHTWTHTFPSLQSTEHQASTAKVQNNVKQKQL